MPLPWLARFLALLLALPVAAAAPVASSGPDLGEKARAVELPIERVMVFSDRARVSRTGIVKLPSAGVSVVRAPDLPGAVQLDSVRVSAEGAKVVRVEIHPVQRQRWSIDQVDGWLAALETKSDEIAVVNGKLDVVRRDLAMLSSLEAAPPIPERDRLKAKAPPPVLATDDWRVLQDHLALRRSAARAKERALEIELRALTQKFEQAQREVQRRDLGGFSDQRLEVLVILDAARADCRLSLEYAVPSALWKPAYDLYFDADAGKVELKASGLVSQATGEDWSDVKLALSTAIPGVGIAMPALFTWTLGDDREYVPQPSARAAARSIQLFAPPAPKPRLADLERQADLALLANRSQQLLAMATSAPPVSAGETLGSTSGIDFNSLGIGSVGPGGGGMTQPGGAAGYGRSAGASSPAPPPASARPSMPSQAPQAMGRYQSDKVAEDSPFDGRGSRGSHALNLYARQAWAPPRFSDPTLPAVTAGGFDYVYEAPVVTTVPSEANQLRVPLAARSYEVTTFYEATPSLATTAYLKAVVKNGSKLPILAGPANVFVNRTFAGDAQLVTTGPGGTLELPLGADENIRLTRTVIPQTQTKGFLIGHEDVTDYTVKIDIGNYKKRAITLRVIDQIPKTNEEKVKVELVSASPRAEKSADADGLLHWHIDVPANGTKTMTFTYRITRPKGWRLSQ